MPDLSRRFLFSAAAAILLAAPALAQSTSSITTIAPESANQGKLATRTEIIAERGEIAMVTVDSVAAQQRAIEMYRAIAIQGGWPVVEPAKLQKGVKSEAVVLLRQRL